MSIWGPIGAAAINVGGGLLGGFLNRGRSQRDLMWDQRQVAEDYARWSAKTLPTLQMHGLRAAGINPMLPYSNGGAPPIQQMTPAVAAPVNPGDQLGRAVAAGVSSAIDVSRTQAQIEEIEARADLLVKQALTEAEKPAHVRAQTQQAVDTAMNQRQAARLSAFDQALRREQQVVANREAIVAGIQAGLWKEADEVVSAFLQKLQLSEQLIPKALGLIDELRSLDDRLQEGAKGMISDTWNWITNQFE